jgi:hypothetical protein
MTHDEQEVRDTKLQAAGILSQSDRYVVLAAKVHHAEEGLDYVLSCAWNCEPELLAEMIQDLFSKYPAVEVAILNKRIREIEG